VKQFSLNGAWTGMLVASLCPGFFSNTE